MKRADRILVISLRYMGDVLLTTPLLRSLRRAQPEARLDMLVFKAAAGMLEGNPDVNEVWTIEERPSAAEHRALARRLWRSHDLALVAETGDRPHLYGWLAARRRVGLLPPEQNKAWWKRRLLDQAVVFHAHDARMPAYRALLDRLGLPWLPEIVAPTAGVTAAQWRARHGLDLAQPYAVVHLAPRFRYKRWHASGWLATLQWLHAQGLRVVVTGGGDATERAYVEEVLGASRVPVLDLSGKLRFAETADLLRGARLYIGPDTATSHLAAACGIPTVALFGPTDPRLWGPSPQQGLAQSYDKVASLQTRGNVWLIQEPSLPCVPCQQEGCERHRESYSACLDTMSAERVEEVLRAALVETRGRTP